jgi:multidrug resistance protein, MATE family
MAALFQVVDAMQVVALSLLRGLQDTTVPMIMAIVSYWLIGMPVAYVFGFSLGWAEAGIWLGLTTGLAAAAILLMLRFWGRAVRIGGADV